jgi:RsmE family RNA methyltransferase
VNLILLDGRDGADGSVVTLSDARAAHMIDVLRVVPGQAVRVGVIDGPLGVGTVEAVTGRRVTLGCAFEATPPPRPPVDLLLAVPRPKVLRRLWAQLAALGVGHIILTNAEKVERPYFDTHVLDESCYRPLLIEGLQQARDTRLPVVTIQRRFKPFVEDQLDELCGTATRIVADPAGTQTVHSVVQGAASERVLVAVGPEGGWNGFELDLLRARGFRLAGLGSRTLRVDTACIALLSLVHAALAER